MAKVLKELKDFMMRGNVVDMAVGVIIGGAFGKIVSSLVSDVIMPPIGMILNGVNFSDLKVTLKEATTDAAGQAVEAVTVIFFAVKLINSFHSKKEEEAPAAPPAPSKEETLLAEIRDLLKEQNEKK